MAADLVIAPEAELDIAVAYAWYEDRRVGLGEEFLSSVEACIESIRRRPALYAIVHEEYLRNLIRRFPYAVYYEYSGRNGHGLRSFSCLSRPGQMVSAASVIRYPERP